MASAGGLLMTMTGTVNGAMSTENIAMPEKLTPPIKTGKTRVSLVKNL